MKIILVMAASVDGRITNGRHRSVSPSTSHEDSALFSALLKKYPVIVMGRKTYEAARTTMRLRADKLRIVLTRTPEKFAWVVVPGSLEFTNESPKSLITRLGKNGYSKALLVGGGDLNAAFFASGLVSELHLTVEPVIFGSGRPLVSDLPRLVSLELLRVRKLNKTGSLHLIYRVNVR